MEEIRGGLKKNKMRSYTICTHQMVLFGHKMNENEIGGAHGTY
jgi:hypothetical protein